MISKLVEIDGEGKITASTCLLRSRESALVADCVPLRIYHLTHAQLQEDRDVRFWARESIYGPNYSR